MNFIWKSPEEWRRESQAVQSYLLNQIMNDLTPWTEEKCRDVGQCKPLTMVETLSQKRTQLTAQLTDVDMALKALESNPEVVNLLELIRRVQRY